MLPDLDDQTDHRQWTQQHLDAADLRASATAPTPPQGEADADCMDVNVRGPGRWAASHPHWPRGCLLRAIRLAACAYLTLYPTCLPPLSPWGQYFGS